MAQKKPAQRAQQAPHCPCGSGALYAACCGRYIDDFANTPAPGAEPLMRSRYTAFVQERESYLLATWHAAHRPQALDFSPPCQWLDLAIKDVAQTSDVTAEVEFIARYKVQGRAVRLHERSRFVCEQGRWFYTDGDQF